MINTLIWGFDALGQDKAVKCLQKEKIINISLWVGDYSFCDIIMDEQFNLKIKSVEFNGVGHEYYHHIYNDILLTFIDMYSRVNIAQNFTFHDYIHVFNIYYNYFSNMIFENSIQLIIFSNIPHFGEDLILYTLAKKFEIKVIVLSQSLEENKFYWMENRKKYGEFRNISNNSIDLKSAYIENTFEKELFYMASVDVKKLYKKRCFFTFLNFIRKLAFRRSRRFNLPTVVKNFHKCLAYEKNHKKIFSVSLKAIENINYVYFPLHLQPELTTSALGGIYSDQLLAIEKLSALLPSDWKIVIKENPKQQYHQRGKLFFSRLLQIPGIIPISTEANTYQLLNNSQFVATISGTVGWEAISGGKNVLVFGMTWYRQLPGVFTYDDNTDIFTIEDLLTYKIDHSYLQDCYKNLLETTMSGVIDKAYAEMMEVSTEKSNEKHLFDSLKLLLLSQQLNKDKKSSRKEAV